MRNQARELVAGARAAIEAHRRHIDDLNVYPVPDGDTGTNLTLTVRAVDEALAETGPDDRAGLAKEIARAALMGARGNSGVILSQIVRGATDALAESDDLSRAFRSASDAAYRAVKKPVEGTMLTAIRTMADAAATGMTLDDVVRAGDEAVARTREMLPVLREAGVVDAGAAGLVEIVRGIASVLSGEPLPEPAELDEELHIEAIHQELSRYRYCTVFVVEGDGLDLDRLESQLEEIGDSLLVVGDRNVLKVHVHTDDPGRALSLGVAQGAIAGVEVANMHEQTHQREERLLHTVAGGDGAATALVAVVAGAGNARLFESGGASVVDGGETMNPSTASLVDAIEAASGSEVVVLPNNKNVIMAAEQAADHSSKLVRVVPTTSLQAGLAALVAFDPSAGAEQNAAAIGEALDALATGAVTIASRDVQLNGVDVRKGTWLGLADGEPVVGGDSFDEVVHAVLARMLAEPRGILTLLTGDDAPVARRRARRHRRDVPRPRARGARRRPAALPAPPGVPSDARARPRDARGGQRHLPGDAGAALRHARRDQVVASVSNGEEASRVVSRVRPDVVLMDYRMPGLNGAEATRAVLRECPEVRVVCLTRVGDAAGDRRGPRRGRRRLRHEGRGLRRHRSRRSARLRRSVNLTVANTAVVLDSTADFPDAPQRFPNFRVVPLYVRFGDESYRDYVDIDAGPSSTSGCTTATELPTTSQPTPGDFLAVYEELGAHVRAHPLAADLLDPVGDVRERRDRGGDCSAATAFA